MIKTYKPNPIKPKDTSLWSSVALTGWKLGGEKNINTQFEYTAKMNAGLTRAIPGNDSVRDTNGSVDFSKYGNFLNYVGIPTLANYGKVTANIAGSLVAVKPGTKTDPAKLYYTQNLIESMMNCQNARTYVINKQLTNLRITGDNFGVNNVSDFPVIMSYMRALMYNTEVVVRPALHIKSLFSYIDSLTNFSQRASSRITQIKNKFMQNKFVKPYNQYLELLSITPLHTASLESMIEFFTIEKANDALNTSYDYVTYESAVDRYYSSTFDTRAIFYIKDGTNTTKIALSDSLEPADFKDRSYLTKVLKWLTISDEEFVKALDDVEKLINSCIAYINTIVAGIAALPTMFAPFYEAIPFLAEYIDTSIYATKNFVNLELPIRRSSYYAKGAVLGSLSVKPTGGIYPTYSATVPLYNGNLEPSDTFDSNGLLYILKEGDWATADALNQSMFVPFVDISGMILTNVIFCVNNDVDLTQIIGYDTADDDGQGLISKMNFEYDDNGASKTAKMLLDLYEVNIVTKNTIVPVLPVKSSVFSVTNKGESIINAKGSLLNAFIYWAVIKGDYIAYASKNKKASEAVCVTSPLVTGYREVNILPVDDEVRKMTPKLLGIRSIPVIK